MFFISLAIDLTHFQSMCVWVFARAAAVCMERVEGVYSRALPCRQPRRDPAARRPPRPEPAG